ncbi:NADH-quinone oxidoreductase subunit J family protein [Hufsiella ginkgonis]|nr:NADH-quinone oxidoreductase subunit J [Hufsiella ginkgonis]
MAVFYLVAFLSIFFSLLVIFSKNPVHSVIYLIITFFTFTIHYVLLNAQFLAIVNFIVYMGAIMVLFLYVLMLLDLNVNSEPVKSSLMKIAGIVAGMCLLVTLAGALKGSGFLPAGAHEEVVQRPNLGLVKNLGQVLFHDFLLPFEVSSLLLLSAMVGAVLLAKREPREI